eukprot:8034377-Ditylum_brightwellii.AAC.1
MAIVHSHSRAGTDGTMLFHGVDNSSDSGDKHITHLSQAVDCYLKKRSKQNIHVDGNKDNGVDNSVDNSVDSGDKHITHLSPWIDCCLMERSKQNKCVDGDKDNDVDNSVDNSVDS